MPNIEINTAQNVTIQYELASLRDRLLAFLLDFLILAVGILILALMLGLALQDSDAMMYVSYFLLLPIFLFYSLISELVGNGQSIGKAVLRIKVVKLNGKHATFGDYLLRWAFRSIDIYMSLGAVASMLISSSSKSQRMGDMLANTALIKVRPTMSLSLNDLLRINSLDNYSPRYAEVRQMSEEDMLLVKAVIERARKYPNNAHHEALDMMTKRMMEHLDITAPPANKMDFLRTLLKDYIVLTR